MIISQLVYIQLNPVISLKGLYSKVEVVSKWFSGLGSSSVVQERLFSPTTINLTTNLSYFTNTEDISARTMTILMLAKLVTRSSNMKVNIFFAFTELF